MTRCYADMVAPAAAVYAADSVAEPRVRELIDARVRAGTLRAVDGTFASQLVEHTADPPKHDRKYVDVAVATGHHHHQEDDRSTAIRNRRDCCTDR